MPSTPNLDCPNSELESQKDRAKMCNFLFKTKKVGIDFWHTLYSWRFMGLSLGTKFLVFDPNRKCFLPANHDAFQISRIRAPETTQVK